MDIRTLLADELDRRRVRNPRYSLRAFARHLGTHHSSVLRIIQGGAGRGIGGGIWPAPPQAPSFVQLFVEVPDVDASIAEAQALGATVVVPKAVLPDGDEMAVLRDPIGVTFGLCLRR